MIIKVQTHQHKDRFLVEAAYINWEYQNEIVILEIYIVSTHTKKVGDAARAFTVIEEEPSLQLRINDGDRVFIMNNEGKTIDSKTVLTSKESRGEARKDEYESRGLRHG